MTRTFSPEGLRKAGLGYIMAHTDEQRARRDEEIARAIAEDCCLIHAGALVSYERALASDPCRICGAPFEYDQPHALCVAREKRGLPTPPIAPTFDCTCTKCRKSLARTNGR